MNEYQIISSILRIMWKLLQVYLLLPYFITVAGYNYREVLGLSCLFYDAQRSGKLPENFPIHWRGDSALNDTGDDGEDLTGGFYDAGDLVKFNFPMAYSMTVLAWGVVSNPGAYAVAKKTRHVTSILKWGAEYLMKCHVSPHVLYAQVGDGDVDHGQWGRAEDMTQDRPAFKIDEDNPGADLAGETAAALAAISIIYKDPYPRFSNKLLKHAKELYEFSLDFPGSYSDSIPQVVNFYKSWSGYKDEHVWASIWLYKATGDQQYLEAAERLYKEYGMERVPGNFGWDDKLAGVQVLLAQITNKEEYKKQCEEYCDNVIKNIKRTPKGLVFVMKWGPLRYAANNALICLEAAKAGIKTRTYRTFAKQQIDYMLGDGGRSFVIGYGKDPPQRPHHRGSSCPDIPAPCGWNEFNSKDPNPQVLYGALVGGPDENDTFNDARDDYVQGEVALDYNAGFQSAVAGLINLHVWKVSRGRREATIKSYMLLPSSAEYL